MFKPLSLLTAVFCLASSALPALAADAPKPLRALLITGGCCHDFKNQKGILTNGISERANVEFTVVHEGGDTREHEVSIYANADWAKGYDVIIHDECFGMVTNVALVERIAAAHAAGLPAVLLHCSNHSYRAAKTEEWRKVVGITSNSHEKRRDFTVKNLKPEHPVMKGFPMEWADKADELYKNEKIWPNTVPLAQAYGEDTKKDHFVIWVTTHEKGRVFNTSLGHGNETVQDPLYLDLVTRGLLWTCNKLDDSGKPVAGYGPAKK